MATIEERLSDQFYAWEQRGRGWHAFEYPVSPEPPFRPFFGHYLPPAAVIDDGRRPTFLSSLVKKFAAPDESPSIPEPVEEPEPDLLERTSLVELQVSLPQKFSAKPPEFNQVFAQLTSCREPVSFEIIGTAESIHTQLAAHPDDTSKLRRQLKAHFPDAVLVESEGVLQDAWELRNDGETAIVEFGLKNEFFCPLADVSQDAFTGIIGALAELTGNELGLFQVIFQPTENEWAESIIRSVTDSTGKPFFVNAPEFPRLAQEKVSSHLYAAVVRIATKADDFDRAWSIARDLASALRVFARVDGNELIPLHNEDYPYEAHCEDVVLRQSRRSGMILNADELVGFVHFPSPSIREPKLVREVAKTKAVPKSATQLQAGLFLGRNTHAGQSTDVRLTTEQRGQHTHIIGVSGSGKSTMLFNLIRQDIENGEGLAVLDPHGDLIDRILGVIPPERADDVILIDPADEAFSVGFNILSAHSDLERTLLASDLVSVFQRLSTSWGDQMASVLQNAIFAFLASSQGGTLVELRRFLIEPGFRNKFLNTVTDPNTLYYWKKGFQQLSGNKSIGPVITRLDNFLAPRPICNMVSQRENRLDFTKIMDTGKIFLAKLSHGQIGKENSFLLGSLFVAKFQQTAMSRQAQAAASRRPFLLYLDEFHNFITPSMAEILSGARKYGLGLILAHQELRQLERDRDVSSAVLSHPYTRAIFRVGDADARTLESGLSFFEAQDLQNLDRGHAVCRLERSANDFNLTIPPPIEVPPEISAENHKRAVTASREKYGTPKADVEAALLRQLGLMDEEPPPEPKSKAAPAVPILSETKTIPKPAEAPKAETKPEPVPVAAPKPAEIQPEPPKEAPTTIQKPMPPRDLGRGGEQHKTIQERIQAEAHALGFMAEIEKQLAPGSIEAADLILRKGDIALAVEISISTTVDHEFGNVKKCLAAGFSRVAVVSPKPEKLKAIAEAVKAGLGSEAAAKVSFQIPDELIAELRTLAAQAAKKPEPPAIPGESKVLGWNIRRHKPALTPEERQAKESVALSFMADAMKKK